MIENSKISDFNSLIENYTKIKHDFFFIQIGANDGKIRDPIYNFVIKYDWNGIFIEPQKYPFKQLKENYVNAKGKLFFENLAIGKKNCSKILYKIGFSTSRWATGLASFNKNVLLRHFENGYVEKKSREEGINIPQDKTKLIVEEEIQVISFQELINKYNIEQLDLLQIDTEGYDFEIIKSINFNNYGPKIIHYENYHLSVSDKNLCQDLLEKNNYVVINYKYDSVAFLNSLFHLKS